MSTGASPSSLLTAEELQCLHCDQGMFHPIFQCTHGHSACYNCREIEGTNSCPLCTEKLRKIRYPLHCRFKSLGCQHIIPSKYIEKHEYRECKYRPYDCHFFSIDYCSFEGDIPQVFSHLKDDHMVAKYDDDSTFKLNYRELNYPRHTILCSCGLPSVWNCFVFDEILEVCLQDFPAPYYAVAEILEVVNHFGKKFYWHFELFPENANMNVLVVTVRLMGEIEEAVQFWYGLQIKGIRGKSVASGLCGSVRFSAEIEFPYDGAGLIIPNNVSQFIIEYNQQSVEIKGHIWDR